MLPLARQHTVSDRRPPQTDGDSGGDGAGGGGERPATSDRLRPQFPVLCSRPPQTDGDSDSGGDGDGDGGGVGGGGGDEDGGEGGGRPRPYVFHPAGLVPARPVEAPSLPCEG